MNFSQFSLFSRITIEDWMKRLLVAERWNSFIQINQRPAKARFVFFKEISRYSPIVNDQQL